MKTDEQDLVVMEDEAIRQGRVVKSIPEPGTVMIEPSPDFEAGWLAARANPPRVEGFPDEASAAEFRRVRDEHTGSHAGPPDWLDLLCWDLAARWAFAQGTLAAQPAPEERKGEPLSVQVDKIEQENRRLSGILGQINATLMVNFGPAGREKQILDGSENEHEALFKVLLSYVRTQAPTEERKVEPSPLTDEELKELREIEINDAADAVWERFLLESYGIRHGLKAMQDKPCIAHIGKFVRPVFKGGVAWRDTNPTRAPTEPTREQVDGIFVSQEDWNNLKFHISRADNYKQHTLAKGLMRDIEMKAPFAEKGGG